ncbi:uncharacterized protein Tco025E_00033 [Trypanosoma conorhini]|uniref:Uncharacterized protein n=1 Tax=Trypanosoma conorhini TaxID=83891 RepID=A0A3R7PMJ6_9TRYP|nr:uncharacterized protein Tco025E_00033 [Trypanosoma conorhini]RNF27649.1 hypothetical protein Tco025E_00033 [Trypanosoma conorhini]
MGFRTSEDRVTRNEKEQQQQQPQDAVQASTPQTHTDTTHLTSALSLAPSFNGRAHSSKRGPAAALGVASAHPARRIVPFWGRSPAAARTGRASSPERRPTWRSRRRGETPTG